MYKGITCVVHVPKVAVAKKVPVAGGIRRISTKVHVTQGSLTNPRQKPKHPCRHRQSVVKEIDLAHSKSF